MSELTETYRGAIYPWQCDHMGHMNVMWYVGKFDEATWNLFAAMGVTASFLRENQRGMAAVQQNITYRHELYAGETVSVRSAFLEVREKVAKFVHEMRNAESGQLAAICVLTGVHIDTETRKSCPFPPEILKRGQDLVRAYPDASQGGIHA
jgi:acyl-CoA thioester hydrolase